jgi:ferredoxin-type protein NapG
VPKHEVVLGKAVIQKETCLAWLETKRCKDCYQVCKDKAIRLEKRRFPEIEADKCNGCGLCVQRCPAVAGTIKINYGEAVRYPAGKDRFAFRPEDRVEPYEFPPDKTVTWLKKRLEKIAGNHGFTFAKKEEP